MTLEIGGVIAAIILASVAVWRVHRTEARHDQWVAAEGQEAKAKETVRQVREDLADYRTAAGAERERLEGALAGSRRDNDELRSKLVELRAVLAEKEIDLSAQMREVARLGAQVDRLLAGNGWPTVDARPPHLNADEED